MATGRRGRIFEALECQSTMDQVNRTPVDITADDNLTGVPKLQRIAMRCIAFTTSHLPPDQRLKRVENWNNFLLSDEGLKVLADEFDRVSQKEEAVTAMEEKLRENNIKLDENMFRSLCSGELVPGETELVSEPETAPLCASTPQLEPQIPAAVVPAAVVMNPAKKRRISPPLPAPVPEIPAYIKTLLLKYDSAMVVIGPNGTMVSRKALISINWTLSVANATRKMLMEVFDRDTLASHTLSGKPSPAFIGCNKPEKQQLDERKVKDLTHVLTCSLNMTEKEVRQAITTKCADENKMWRQRMQKLMDLKSKESRINNEPLQ